MVLGYEEAPVDVRRGFVMSPTLLGPNATAERGFVMLIGIKAMAKTNRRGIGRTFELNVESLMWLWLVRSGQGTRLRRSTG